MACVSEALTCYPSCADRGFTVVLELGALSIALVVLFSDSMESLFPAISATWFKIMFFFM